MSQAFGFSPDFDILWRNSAQKAQGKSLNQAVMSLSDFFIQERAGSTPWHQRGTRQAYELYFHPLNYLRARRAVRKAHQQGFFQNLRFVMDWGCGLGALTRALWDELPASISNHLTVVAVDRSQEALDGYLHWNQSTFKNIKTFTPSEFSAKFHPLWSETCLAMSYSLNEMKDFDLLSSPAEALLILEPSTFGLARRLQQFRAEALNAGYFPYSPCTHRLACPLLTSSRKDWCFDRLRCDLPELWDELFSSLPIKNKTITYSALALKRTPAQVQEPFAVRLVGDDLREKGKTKWLACAGERKFFLVWLSKWGEAPAWKRGDLLKFPAALAKELEGGGEIKVPADKFPVTERIS